jgi:hypothetical protein
MIDAAIFLGAGASKAEGAPLLGELFGEYFSSPSFRRSRTPMDRELKAFFREMFSMDGSELRMFLSDYHTSLVSLLAFLFLETGLRES